MNKELDSVYKHIHYTCMLRTQIYITEEEKSGLNRLVRTTGISQSELIRQAIDSLLNKNANDEKLHTLEQIAGMWEDRSDLVDFAGIRQSFDRGLVL